MKSKQLGKRMTLLALAATLTSVNAFGLGAIAKHLGNSTVSFAVLSDLHWYDTHLGTTGAAFADYLAQDPKLLAESDAILDAAVANIVKQRVNFVIVPGDLTKDGELVNHLGVAKHFKQLEQRGIQVFVVPGNHDINNSDAVRYIGNKTRRVPTVTPQLFRTIYRQFGYDEAIERDHNSLSYVAEPVRGVWLLAIDSCKYDESKTNDHPVVSGRIRPETMVWIRSVMQKANARNKQVVAFMHHGVNQHFFGESDLFSDFLVDDWTGTSVQLAQTGLKVIFTGHYHSTDAAYLVNQTLTPLSPLCDVETASLATYPCAFRIAALDFQKQLSITTQRVTDIRHSTGGIPFQQYAFTKIYAPTLEIATTRIMSMFGLPREQAAAVAPLVTQGIIANYAGDEMPSAQTQAIINSLMTSTQEPDHTFGLILWGLWTDLPPGDGTLTLSLAN
ncbi:MAG TPA: metallophosphoesterase [Candidatus Paceibacterota bacterium]|nr:metallophosphoesterase [Candidatus Paceibacterota bacterium]